MPGARSGGSGGDGSHSGGNSGDASGPVTVWEVVSLLGKLLGTVAALKVVLYLLRVCLAMAWKSGGASHSELIHNLCKNGIIKTDKVFEVMLATDRAHYAKCNPYMDSPQSIGKLWISENVTFSCIYSIIFVSKIDWDTDIYLALPC